jgi:Ca2+-binding RTX toxin-like protein
VADDYGQTKTSAGTVGVGSTRSGTIETVGDTDWFKITLQAGATYRFDLEGAPTGRGTLVDTFLRLRDADGNSIRYDDDGGSGLNSRIASYTPTVNGTFFLSVGSGNDGTGTYRLTTSQISPSPAPDDYGSTASTAGSVSIGATRSGSIEKSGDTDWFRTSLVAGHTYQVDVEGGDTGRGTLADPYGSIRNGSGSKVAESNDGGTGNNSRFTWTVPTGQSGTYFVAAGSNNNGSGSYRVKLTDVTPTLQNTSYSLTSVTSVNEGRQLVFTIGRVGDKPAETVYFSTLADGTATFASGDYALAGGGEPKNIAVRFSEGETTETVTLDIRNDGSADAGERFRAILQRDDADLPAQFLVRSDFVTITEGAQNTTYTLTPSASLVWEGGQVVFTITRAGDLPGGRIYFSAWQESASYKAGDYRLATGGEPSDVAVDFRSGETTKTVTLNILQDGQTDPGERFRAVIQGDPPSPDPSDNLASTGFVTIDEGPAPPPQPDGDDFRDDPTDSSAPFGSLSVGGSATGIIGLADGDDTFGDKDVFRVELVQGQAYEVRLASTSVSAAAALPAGLFTVRSPGDFNDVVETSGSGSNVTRNFIADQSGYYYVRVGSGDRAGDQGGYRLSVTNITPAGGADDFSDYPGDTGAIGGVPTLGMGPSRTGVIETPGDTDIFAVSLVGGHKYQFSLESLAAGGFGGLQNVYFTLRGSDNFEFRLAQNGGSTQSAFPYTAEQTGTYYIRVGSGSSGGVGGYRLDVVDKGIPAAATPTPVATNSGLQDAISYFGYLLKSAFTGGGQALFDDKSWYAFAGIMVRMNDFEAAQFASKIAGPLSGIGIGLHVAEKVLAAPPGQGARAAYIETMNELAGFLISSLGARGGAVVATLAAKKLGPFASISAGLFGMAAGAGAGQVVYHVTGASKYISDSAAMVFDHYKASTSSSAASMAIIASTDETSDPDLVLPWDESSLVRFDEAWYLSRHPEVAEAIAAGQVGSAYSHFITIGIDLGYAPNATQQIDRSDLAVELINNDPAAFGSSAPMSLPIGTYAGDGISNVESAVLSALNRARASGASLTVDALVSAIANRKAADLEANFPDSAAKTAYDNRVSTWAEDWSNGNALTQQFRGAFEALLGADTTTGRYAMFVVSSPDVSTSTVMAWLQSQQGFSAAIANASFDTVGIAELGGVWVVIFVDRSSDYIVTAPGSDTLSSTIQYGSGELDALYAGNRTAQLYGLGGSDTLVGGPGNDRLDGGADGDYMRGGAGDDIYVVDNIADTIVEGPGEGDDRIVASVSYTMRAGVYVEALAAETGTAALVLAGNELDNRIFGNAGDNTLWGMAGNDYLAGVGGDDIYNVDAAGDQAVEAAGQGYDWVFTSVSYALAQGSEVEGLVVSDRAGTQPLDLTGNEIRNGIFGNAGANILDGGGGADYLEGGAGNDIYLVDDQNDYVTEKDGEGDDRIVTRVSYSLAGGVYVELLAADPAATSGLVLAGNELDNRIQGGAGGDTIWGLGGNDVMAGLGGDDTYVIDSSGDQVIENADQGYDRIFVPFTYVLGAGVDVELLSTLNYEGVEQIDLTGNDFDQALFGNAASNHLIGGGGDDYLYGAAGADIMEGGTGDDSYSVDTSGDVVVEAAGAGTDTVLTSLGSSALLYALPAFVENLVGTSAAGQGVGGNGLDNILTLGDGNDFIVLEQGGNDTVIGGGGNDYIFLGAAFTAADAIDGGGGSDTVALLGSYVLTLGAPGLVNIETLSLLGAAASLGAHVTYSITTVDANVPTGGRLTIYGGGLLADETLFFNGYAETDGALSVYGGAGNDTFAGGPANDAFVGGAGDDLMYGLGGMDWLEGGLGADTMRGGPGNDVFVYQSAAESNAAKTDHILDFEYVSDHIALTNIDANTAVAGDQAFSFIGSGPFSNTAGELRAYQSGASWFVEGDVNGDGSADLVIQVDTAGGHAMIAGDFYL